jgi:rubredoxin
MSRPFLIRGMLPKLRNAGNPAVHPVKLCASFRFAVTTGALMKTYMCLICGFIFDEAEGDPEGGIPPGTRWDDVPLSWRCPDCGAGKEDFEMVEV